MAERYPIAMPDGRSVIYTMWGGGTSGARVMRRTLEAKPGVPIGLDSTVAVGITDRWIVGSAGGVLRIAPIDRAAERVTGASRQVLDGIATFNSVTIAAVSPDGALAYVAGSDLADLVLLDPGRDTVVISMERRTYGEPRLSPDGRRIASAVTGRDGIDVWVLEPATKGLTRLTDDGRRNSRPEWTPDGSRVFYRSFQDSVMSLWAERWDGTATAERLHWNPAVDLWEGVISPDGAWLLYRTGTLATADIWVRRLAGDTASRKFVASPAADHEARFSPDGRWVAYSSDQSGKFQVYVRAFPSGEARHQVSADGGEQPVWAADGRALYYTGPNGGLVIRARLALSPAFAVTARDTLVRDGFYIPARNGHPMFDVSADGRLLLVRRESASARVSVAIGWLDEVLATGAR